MTLGNHHRDFGVQSNALHFQDVFGPLASPGIGGAKECSTATDSEGGGTKVRGTHLAASGR